MQKLPFKLIDLTNTLSSDIPSWDESCGFEYFVDQDYDPNSTYKFRTHKINMKEGIGTHIDSPAHCFKDGKHIDELDIED